MRELPVIKYRKAFLTFIAFGFTFVTSVIASACGSSGGGEHQATESRDNEGLNPMDIKQGGSDSEGYILEADVKGNGGDVVACFTDQTLRDRVRQRLLDNRYAPAPINPFEWDDVRSGVASLRMFDLYEYTLPTGIPPVRPSVIPVDEPFNDALPKVIKRLAEKSNFAEKLNETLSAMPLSSWRAAPGVVEIDDSDHAIILPSKCLLVQIAVRQDNAVFYDDWLFSQLAEQDRLALVLHELAYKIAHNNNHVNSRAAREAVGIIMAGDGWSELTPWQLHRKLLPLGTFGFSYSAGEREYFVKSIHKESVAGLPIEIELEQPMAMHIGGVEFGIYPQQNKPTVGLRADGSIEWLGNAKQVTGRVLPKESAEKITFSGERVDSMFFRAGRLTLDGELFWNVKVAEFDESGNLRMINVGTSSSAGGIVAPGYGPLMVYGTVQFYPGTKVPVSAKVYCATSLRTVLGIIPACGIVSFYENGNVAEIERVYYPMSYLSLLSGVTLSVRDARLEFFSDGSLAYYQRAETIASSGVPDIRWNFGSFDDVISATFSMGNVLRSVTLSHQGHIIHSEQAPGEGRRVGPMTLELDDEGRIVTPF